MVRKTHFTWQAFIAVLKIDMSISYLRYLIIHFLCCLYCWEKTLNLGKKRTLGRYKSPFSTTQIN